METLGRRMIKTLMLLTLTDVRSIKLKSHKLRETCQHPECQRGMGSPGALTIMQAHTIMRKSIYAYTGKQREDLSCDRSVGQIDTLRTMTYSSAQVHRASGSNR